MPVTITYTTTGTELTKTTDNSSCYIIRSNVNHTLKSGDIYLCETGIMIQLPENTEGQIRTRFSAANPMGLIVLNSPATLNSGKEKSLKVLLYNAGDNKISLTKNQEIANLVFASVIEANLEKKEAPKPQAGKE